LVFTQDRQEENIMNNKGMTRSAAAQRIDSLCEGNTKAPDYSANVRIAQSAVLENLKRAQK